MLLKINISCECSFVTMALPFALLGSVNRCHLPPVPVRPNDSEPAPRFTVATKQARTESENQASIGNRLLSVETFRNRNRAS